MRPEGGGSGFAFPQGDPAALDAGASALQSAAGTLSRAAGQVGSAASAAATSWIGPAAAAFQDAVGSVRGGLDGLAGHHREAAAALTTYASVLSDAQAAATQAGQDYSRAQQQYQSSLTHLTSNPPTGPGAASALAQAQGRAADTLNGAYTSAAAACAHASGDSTHAAQVCAAKLSQIAEDIKATSLHKFLDLMAGPGAVFGLLGVESQMQSGLKMWTVLSDMSKGNWTNLEKIDPAGYQKVLDAAAKYGPDSSQALAAQLEYEADIADSTFGDMAQAATGIGKIPTGVSGALDVLGKVGLVLGVVSDVGMLADGQATGLDKGMAAANLTGIGMAAAGTELGGTALGLLGVDAVAAAIPVAGEVIIAGTAIFFAAEWVHGHWGDITHWGDDVGHGLSTGYHAVVNFGDGAVSEGEHLVNAGLHEAGGLAGGAVHAGQTLLSDLNPFG